MTAFQRRYYAGGGATTTLSSAMGSSDTSFSISSATGWPGTPGHNFLVVIDRGTSSEEKILCSSNSGTVVTVATSGRGSDGTSATTHNSGASVSLCAGAIDFDEANQLTNFLANQAEGSLFFGKGTGTVPNALSVGGAGAILSSNGTDPTWLGLGSIGYYLTAGASSPQWSALPTIAPITNISNTGFTGYTSLTGSWQQAAVLTISNSGSYVINGSFTVENNLSVATIQQVSVVVSTQSAGISGAVVYGYSIFPVVSGGNYLQSIPVGWEGSLSVGTYYINVNGPSTLQMITCTVNALRTA